MYLTLISMIDLTKEERAEAAAQNWGLFHVFDMKRSKWHACVLPLQFTPTYGAFHALEQVISQAKNNHPLSLKALRLMAKSNAGKTK